MKHVFGFNSSVATRTSRPRFVFGRDSLVGAGLARDPDISREHFAIWKGPSGLYYLEDLQSRNGTTVDGSALPFKGALPGGTESGSWRSRAELRDGALIRAGNTLLIFRKQLMGATTPDAPTTVESNPLRQMVSPYGLRETRERTRALLEWVNPPGGRPHARGTEPQFNLLLEAETGTGKEMMARYIATRLRPSGPYRVVNAAALPENLFEATLFGHEKGAFTGAESRSEGLVGAANGGTLFLDEIHQLRRTEQVKLLRFLETRDYLPVGSTAARQANVLVLVASSDVLRTKVAQNEWHRDMFARLNQLSLRLPPLRERAEDIPELCKSMIQRQGQDAASLEVEVEALEAFLLDTWPENLRGLQAALNQALMTSWRQGRWGLLCWAIEGVLQPAEFRPGRSITLQTICQALELKKGDQSKAAEALGINRSKLQRYLAGGQEE